jgi:hypothetical protein
MCHFGRDFFPAFCFGGKLQQAILSQEICRFKDRLERETGTFRDIQQRILPIG